MSQPHRPHYEPPKSRFKAPRRDVLACIVIVTLLAVIIVPVFQQAQNMGRQVFCLSNVRSRTQAIRQYALDHDNVLPLANSWQSRTLTYKDADTPGCPALMFTNRDVLGYAMDSRLSGRSLDRIGAPHDQRILLYESSNLTQNAHDPGTSFTVRHGYGAISFVDGHSRARKQDQGEFVVRKGILSREPTSTQ